MAKNIGRLFYGITSVLCAFSFISLTPTITYSYSGSVKDIQIKAWNMTGNNMKNATKTIAERLKINEKR